MRRTAIALTCNIEAAGSRQLGGTMVMVFMFYVVCCVLLCVQEAVGSPECPPLAHTLSTTYMVSYYV